MFFSCKYRYGWSNLWCCFFFLVDLTGESRVLGSHKLDWWNLSYVDEHCHMSAHGWFREPSTQHFCRKLRYREPSTQHFFRKLRYQVLCANLRRICSLASKLNLRVFSFICRNSDHRGLVILVHNYLCMFVEISYIGCHMSIRESPTPTLKLPCFLANQNQMGGGGFVGVQTRLLHPWPIQKEGGARAFVAASHVFVAKSLLSSSVPSLFT